jgi:hypothetical protein
MTVKFLSGLFLGFIVGAIAVGYVGYILLKGLGFFDRGKK